MSADHAHALSSSSENTPASSVTGKNENPQHSDGFFLFLAKNPRLVLLFVSILLVYISYTLADNIFQIYAAQCLHFCSYGLFTPASAYYINSILPKAEKAKGQAALGIFTFGLSGLIASMLSGILLDHVTVRTMLAIESMIALVGVIGVIICTKYIKQSQ